MKTRGLLLCIFALAFVAVEWAIPAPSDPYGTSSDALRQAAADLSHERRYSEALVLLKQVANSSDARFSDLISLAEMQEKVDLQGDAAISYRRVLEMVPLNPRTEPERAAWREATTRLRMIDPESVKVDEAVDNFIKKLDGLISEAGQARNRPNLQRLLALRVAVRSADKRGIMTSFVVNAADSWEPTPVTVAAGRKYRVTAIGLWHIGNGDKMCDADGRDDIQMHAPTRMGQLLGWIDKSGQILPLGLGVTFTAPRSGVLFVVGNNPDKPGNDSGSMTVTVEPE